MPDEVERQKPGPDPILADESTRREFLELVKLGISLSKSCALVGIEDLKTLRTYRQRNPGFDAEVRRAEKDGIKRVAQVYAVCLAGQGDKVRLDAAKHFLACKDPEGFAKTEKVQHGGSIEITKQYTNVDLDDV